MGTRARSAGGGRQRCRGALAPARAAATAFRCGSLWRLTSLSRRPTPGADACPAERNRKNGEDYRTDVRALSTGADLLQPAGDDEKTNRVEDEERAEQTGDDGEESDHVCAPEREMTSTAGLAGWR